MSSLKILISLGLLAMPVAVLAQAQSVQPSTTTQSDGGLDVTVSDESEWQDLGIAIPGFATDRDVATPAGQTAPLGRQLGEVITADLRNNGLFKPTGPGALPGIAYTDVTAPQFGVWSGRGADMLVHGYVRAAGNGQLTDRKSVV